jgi:hypothetical protein
VVLKVELPVVRKELGLQPLQALPVQRVVGYWSHRKRLRVLPQKLKLLKVATGLK